MAPPLHYITLLKALIQIGHRAACCWSLPSVVFEKGPFFPGACPAAVVCTRPRERTCARSSRALPRTKSCGPRRGSAVIYGGKLQALLLLLLLLPPPLPPPPPPGTFTCGFSYTPAFVRGPGKGATHSSKNEWRPAEFFSLFEILHFCIFISCYRISRACHSRFWGFNHLVNSCAPYETQAGAFLKQKQQKYFFLFLQCFAENNACSLRHR